MGPVSAGLVRDNEDDGYTSPVFDVPSASSDEEDFRPVKKRKNEHAVTQSSLQDEEALALALLQKRKK